MTNHKDLTFHDYAQVWSSLHGGAHVAGIVKWWLHIAFLIARTLHRMKMSPHAVTSFGVLCAVLTWQNADNGAALVWLVLSLASDGVDGTLAIISEKNSRWGATLDAVADRIAEVFWVGAFYALGASLEIVLIIWLAAATQEYVRARAGGLGLRKIGIVTVAERPIRASALCIAIVAQLLGLSWASALALVLAVIQSLSCLTVIQFAYQQFSKD